MSRRRMLLGLIGANIMGSLSPALFAEAFAASGIDGFYHLIDVDRQKERRLPQLLDAIKATGFSGTNVTYPFKQDILPLLDAIDPEAAQIGAINTSRLRRTAGPPGTISIGAAGVAASRKLSAARARTAQPSCRSAPAARVMLWHSP